MNPAKDSFLFRELQVIRKIIDDETWLEGERRGCYVSCEDPVVRERVCAVVLRVGRELRASVLRSMSQMTGETDRSTNPDPEPPTPPNVSQEVAA
jgi:hypothetical protein